MLSLLHILANINAMRMIANVGIISQNPDRTVSPSSGTAIFPRSKYQIEEIRILIKTARKISPAMIVPIISVRIGTIKSVILPSLFSVSVPPQLSALPLFIRPILGTTPMQNKNVIATTRIG